VERAGSALTERELAAWQGYIASHATLIRDLDALLRTTVDLSVAAFAVLHLLSRDAGAPLRMTEIAERTSMTISGVSRLVSGLCEQGFVTREQDHEDGRAWRIALTAQGAATIEAASPAVTGFIRERFSDRFSAEELAAFQRSCDRLNEP